ncbi:MAG: hypothetical protein ACYC5H_17335 [Methylovirgula sp.]
MAWVIAIATAFAFASAASVTAASAKPRHHHVAKHHHFHKFRHVRHHVGYLPRGASEHGRGYTELVGDPQSGLGFYPLPFRYRVGAWRHHMRHRGEPPWIRNGIFYAMMADSVRYADYWATPINSYRYGVYSPFDGVGTPYFAGFYGSSGDDDQPAFPFGRTYPH